MKFVLDTNVVSELMRPAPNPHVLAWMASHAAARMCLASVSEAELRYGIAVLPAGHRRAVLADALEAMLATEFENNVLSFDSAAARLYADFAARRRAAGRPITHADCQIAATAHVANAALATRNIRDFDGLALDVVDPFNQSPLEPTDSARR